MSKETASNKSSSSKRRPPDSAYRSHQLPLELSIKKFLESRQTGRVSDYCVYQELTDLPHKIRAILRETMWPNSKTKEQSKTVRIQKHTALTDAVLRSDYDGMRQIIAGGADLNEFDDFRMTPLLWAITRGDFAAVQTPLVSGADPNTRPNPSDSPLWSAEDDWGFAEIAALLRSYGATK